MRYATAGPTRKYAIHPDDKRIIVATPDTTAAAKYDTVTFVFNFFDELRRLLPTVGRIYFAATIRLPRSFGAMAAKGSVTL